MKSSRRAHHSARAMRKLLRARGTKVRAVPSCMSRSSERDPDGVAGALATHLCLYCAGAACFALVLYYLMQPTRLPNPAMAAYKPPPGALATQTVLLRFGTEPIKAAEPEPENDGRSDCARRQARSEGREEGQNKREPRPTALSATAATGRDTELCGRVILRRLSADVLTPHATDPEIYRPRAPGAL